MGDARFRRGARTGSHRRWRRSAEVALRIVGENPLVLREAYRVLAIEIRRGDVIDPRMGLHHWCGPAVFLRRIEGAGTSA
jgi:hypothetical protein